MMPIAAIVLAAGRSSRFVVGNKLTTCVAGTAIVRRVVIAALRSRVVRVVVVTGYWEVEVQACLADLPVSWCNNPNPQQGLSSSIKVGIGSLGCDVAGAIMCLGDMPHLHESHLDSLCEAFIASSGGAICVPTYEGRRGNPVLWPAQWFEQLCKLQGDSGGRHLLGRHPQAVRWVPVSDCGVLLDVDTHEDLLRS